MYCPNIKCQEEFIEVETLGEDTYRIGWAIVVAVCPICPRCGTDLDSVDTSVPTDNKVAGYLNSLFWRGN